MKSATVWVFVKEENMGDVKNLLLPVEATLYVHGLNSGEQSICEAFAKKLEVFNLLMENGIVLVIREGNTQIEIAGADAIEEYIKTLYSLQSRRENMISLENV